MGNTCAAIGGKRWWQANETIVLPNRGRPSPHWDQGGLGEPCCKDPPGRLASPHRQSVIVGDISTQPQRTLEL